MDLMGPKNYEIPHHIIGWNMKILLPTTHCLPSGMHWCDWFPCVSPDVEPLPTRHAHSSIISTNAVEESIKCTHPTAWTATTHGRCWLPPAHPWVEPLHTGLIVGRVKSSKCIYTVLWNPNQMDTQVYM